MKHRDPLFLIMATLLAALACGCRHEQTGEAAGTTAPIQQTAADKTSGTEPADGVAYVPAYPEEVSEETLDAADVAQLETMHAHGVDEDAHGDEHSHGEGSHAHDDGEAHDHQQ